MANNLSSVCISIADAIRLRAGVSASMTPYQFVSYVDAIPEDVTYNDDILFFTKALTSYYESWPGLTTIYSSTFANFSLLSYVNVPNVYSVQASAFYNCSSLSTFIASSTFNSIGSYAFYNTLLSRVPYASNLTYVGGYAFYLGKLNQLESMMNVSYFGEAAFSTNRSLTGQYYLSSLINLSRGVLTVGNGLFDGTSLQFLDSIISVGSIYNNGSLNFGALFYDSYINHFPNLQIVSFSNVRQFDLVDMSIPIVNLTQNDNVVNRYIMSGRFYNTVVSRLNITQTTSAAIGLSLGFMGETCSIKSLSTIFNDYLDSVYIDEAPQCLDLISMLPATYYNIGHMSISNKLISINFPMNYASSYAYLRFESIYGKFSVYFWNSSAYFSKKIYIYLDYRNSNSTINGCTFYISGQINYLSIQCTDAVSKLISSIYVPNSLSTYYASLLSRTAGMAWAVSKLAYW